MSSWLSEIAFGNSDYTVSFILISIAIFFNQLTVGNLAILQGLRKLNNLAKATLWASFCSLIVIIPLYYYFGVNGIALSLVIAYSSEALYLIAIDKILYKKSDSK